MSSLKCSLAMTCQSKALTNLSWAVSNLKLHHLKRWFWRDWQKCALRFHTYKWMPCMVWVRQIGCRWLVFSDRSSRAALLLQFLICLNSVIEMIKKRTWRNPFSKLSSALTSIRSPTLILIRTFHGFNTLTLKLKGKVTLNFSLGSSPSRLVFSISILVVIYAPATPLRQLLQRS